MVLHLACFEISFICQTQIKKKPANNQRFGSAGEINAKALAPTVAVRAYCQIAFYAFAAFLCNSNLDIRIVGFSGCPQYTVTRSIVIIMLSFTVMNTMMSTISFVTPSLMLIIRAIIISG